MEDSGSISSEGEMDTRDPSFQHNEGAIVSSPLEASGRTLSSHSKRKKAEMRSSLSLLLYFFIFQI
jgi:hypothetical protein